MILLLDMGNSRLKSAELDKSGELSQFVSTAYEGGKPIACLEKHLEHYGVVQKVILVSVLGSAFQTEVVNLLGELGIPLHWVKSEDQAHGVINQYQQPSQLGSDRFVALVAAKQAFPDQNCVVIDCGTAVTIDALSREGTFCGGVIIPGLKLWSDSLVKRAGQLNDHRMNDVELFAKDTAQAIGSGSILGLTSAVEGIAERMQQKLVGNSTGQVPVKLVICGGDAELVNNHSQLSFELMPHLVLIGLAKYT